LVDTDEASIPELRTSLSEVVGFLEHLVGVRYYPPVTFLVDEHIIPSIKPAPQPSRPCVPETPLDDEAEHLIALLQCLALAFHVGKLTASENVEYDQRAQFYDAADPANAVEFQHVVRMSEYVFAYAAKSFLRGADIFVSEKRSFGEVL